ERVLADLRRRQELVAFVEQLREPHIGADAAVVLAARADVEVRLVLAREQHVLAARALDPQVVGRLALLGEGGQRVTDAGEPAHRAAPRMVPMFAVPMRAAERQMACGSESPIMASPWQNCGE